MRRRPTLTLAILRSSSHRRIAACVTFSRSAACPTVSKLHSELPIPNLPFAPFVCANWRVWRRLLPAKRRNYEMRFVRADKNRN